MQGEMWWSREFLVQAGNFRGHLNNGTRSWLATLAIVGETKLGFAAAALSYGGPTGRLVAGVDA